MTNQPYKKSMVSGVLLLDKPSGISSHEALFAAKKCLMSSTLDSKKAGHTGTLDPMATGLLPICFGAATKFSQFGLDADKGYTASIRLGASTDTGDADGQIIQTQAVPDFCQADLDDIAKSFVGERLQVPPMYSALKKDGKKLYEYARAGVAVERVARPIVIYHLALKRQNADSVALDVRCSKGMYVRVLAEEIAVALGTVGHLTTLRRTATGGFDVSWALTLETLASLDEAAKIAALRPIDSLLMHLPSLVLTGDDVARLQLGQRLNVKSAMPNIAISTPQLVRLYQGDGMVFVGLGELAPTGRLQPKKMVFA